MDIQWLIVIIIVAISIIIATYKIIKNVFLKKNNDSICTGGTGCDLRNEMKIRQKQCSDNSELKNIYSKKSNKAK